MSKPIIVAVDETQLSSFKQTVDSLDSNLCMIKVGSVSFNSIGHEAIRYAASKGFEIFLDLKLHDIPNTVEKGLIAILKLKPIFTTIHISGGDNMQKLSSKRNNKITKVLGVTVLTSLDKRQTLKYYKEKNVNNLVTKFAKYAKNNNLSGLVCSPLEIKILRKEVGKKMILVVPGIRLEKKFLLKKDDQKRTLTPKEAIKLGADYLVIGRPIIESKNPLETIKKINQSIK